MASMAISLQLKPRSSIRNPTLIRFFSSSSSSTTPDASPNGIPSSSPSQSPSETSFSSFVSDVKSNLNQQSPPQQQKPHTPVDILQRLAQFRQKTTPSSRPSSDPLSFQGPYQRNSSRRGQETQKREPISFEAIHENLKKLAPSSKDSNLQSKLREGFNMRSRDSNIIGGSGDLPSSVFGREMNDEVGESPERKLQFMKSYEHGDLGMKLIELRPKNLKEFSIKELNERLVKVREIEEAEAATKGRNPIMRDLRNSLMSIGQKIKGEEKNKSIKRIDILGHLGRTPSFMLSPPKEHLVEKYFHPDNMSSAEKLKIELQKVRDEFKMSETDCGSARVQVAQLTTKIKHLTTALHKKDKHSRKGLQEMVQRRKKLLKYLRRTDWDSYCLVLSKLGLRDRPDLKIK